MFIFGLFSALSSVQKAGPIGELFYGLLSWCFGYGALGLVPRAESQNLWETYKHHVEKFYDFLHLNRELRELDYKHNYEEKLKIIERAEVLQEAGDVLRASRDLNTLHQLWKNDPCRFATRTDTVCFIHDRYRT